MKTLILFLIFYISLGAQSNLLMFGDEGNPYDNAETQTYLASLTTALTSAQAAKIDNFITTLKDSLSIDALSEKFDVMYLFKNETDESGKKNLVKRNFDCIESGTVEFTAYVGQKGNGSNGYFKTGYVEATHGVAASINSVSMGAYITDRQAGVSTIAGVYANAKRLLILSLSDSTIRGDVNSGAGGPTISMRDGLYVMTRISSDRTNYYANGDSLSTQVAAAAIPDSSCYIFAYNNGSVATSLTTTNIEFFFIGSGLTTAEVGKIYNCYNAYRNQVNPLISSTDVYIMSGQSNMDGRGTVSELPAELQAEMDYVYIWYGGTWQRLQAGVNNGSTKQVGPEIEFGYALFNNAYTKIHLLKYAVGGTSLQGRWMPYQNDLYANLTTNITNGLTALTNQGIDYTVKGFIWMQGESDALDSSSAENYETNIDTFMTTLRANLSLPNLPVYIGRISDEFGGAWADTVRARQTSYCDTAANTTMIDTDSYEMQADNTHYTTAGYIQFGDDLVSVIYPSLYSFLYIYKRMTHVFAQKVIKTKG